MSYPTPRNEQRYYSSTVIPMIRSKITFIFEKEISFKTEIAKNNVIYIKKIT